MAALAPLTWTTLLLVPALACLGCGSSGAGGARESSLPAIDGGGTDGSSEGGGVDGMVASCRPGLASGFSPQPASFALPPPRCQVAFDALARQEAGGGLSYLLVDLTADGRADLVVTADACDEEVGSTRWDIYVAGETGFAESPTPYAIPPPRCGNQFSRASHVGGRQGLDYALLDMTDDRRPDLVVFFDDCDRELGRSRWDVYVGGETAFGGEPTPYPVPSGRCQMRFDAPANFATASGLGYTLLDLSGDGMLDLLVFFDGCAPRVGSERWDLYLGSRQGFAPTPSLFSLPANRCAARFDAPAKTRSDADVAYSLLDLSGDGRPDLVIHSDACDGEIGSSRWAVHQWTPTGFAAEARPYALPAPRCQTLLDQPSASGAVAFALADLSCDGRADLVFFADECAPDVGTMRWDVYLGGSAGFASQQTPLALPAPRCQVPFAAAAASSGGLGYVLDGFLGGRPELVVFSDACDQAVGRSRWDIYGMLR